MRSPVLAGACAGLLALVAPARPAAAQGSYRSSAGPATYGQPVQLRIQIPGLGQAVAEGSYFFKFALVDPGGAVQWTHDGSGMDGREPSTSLTLPVAQGILTVTLGDPPQAGFPPIPAELLERSDLMLRVWAASSASGFRRLGDVKLRGQGLAYAAEVAHNAELLEGRRASDFETAGAAERHERAWVHTPLGHIPGGRLYHASADLGAGRELSVHFDVPDLPDGPARIQLDLHGSPLTGPPSIGELKLRTLTSRDIASGATVDVADVSGPGWLGGIRESYEYCQTCFKRKLPPETEAYLDGVPLEAWRAARGTPAEGVPIGKVDSFLALGLMKFERSLKIVSRNRAADAATGTTNVWFYTADAAAVGAPGAIQVLLDGGDITPALAGLPAAGRGVRVVQNRLVAARFDGISQPADGLDPNAFLTRRPDTTWLSRGPGAVAHVAGQAGSLLVVGEMDLAAGDRRIALGGSVPAVLEIRIDGQWQRAVVLTAPGTADATLTLPAGGGYPIRVLASSGSGDLAVSWTVDGVVPRVRTLPLIGGEGGESWSAAPLDLGAAGLVLAPGPHVLTLRERGGRSGHIEYSLLVE